MEDTHGFVEEDWMIPEETGWFCFFLGVELDKGYLVEGTTGFELEKSIFSDGLVEMLGEWILCDFFTEIAYE